VVLATKEYKYYNSVTFSMAKKKSILRIAFSRIIGLLVFLLIVFLVNYLAVFTSNEIFDNAVKFLNTNVWLLVMLGILFGIGELFGALQFPLNLPAPVFNAIGAVYLVTFIFRVFGLVENVVGFGFPGIFRWLSYLISVIVFVIVIIVGYVMIFTEIGKKKHKEKHKKKSKD